MKLFEQFEDDARVIMIIELMEGKTLYDFIVSQPPAMFTENLVSSIIRQILLGLSYCHEQNLAHRDIKAENIMFLDAACTQLKLIDFGFAKIFKEEESKYQTALGTPLYMAPEVVKRQPYDQKCDIWGTGILSFALISGELPYDIEETTSVQKLLEQIKIKKFSLDDMRSGAWAHVSKEAKNFILEMLVSNPAERPKAIDLLKDPWLQNSKKEQNDPIYCKNVVSKLSAYNVLHVQAYFHRENIDSRMLS